MDSNELKNKLSKLWKDTFHDNDDYISLVFNNYYDPRFSEYEETGGEVVAGLVGIPYEFGNAEKRIRALYLCGLATRQQYRSRGIMTRLLARVNEKAREAGFAFTFLIPSDDGLRKYYHDREYVNAFYRVIDNYTSLHDFNREYESILLEQKEKVAELKRRYYSSLKTSVFDHMAEDSESIREGIRALIRGIEDRQQDLQIIHSDRDIRLLISENVIDKGKIHYVCNQSGTITAAAFTTYSDNSVNIIKLFCTDLASKYKVLDSVKRLNPDLAIQHYVSSMARILDFSEVLKFQAECRHDLKYSILAKTDDNYTFEQIDVREGKLKIKKLAVDDLSHSQVAHVMSKRDIGEILFRRRDTDNLITEAFGIPSINGAICLMLD